jgi:hypothetical protein
VERSDTQLLAISYQLSAKILNPKFWDLEFGVWDFLADS